MTADLVLGLHAAGDKSARQRIIDKACAGGRVVLRDVALDGLDLSGLELLRVDLDHIDLRGALFGRTIFSSLVDCVLDGVDAACSNFPYLERCRARGADLHSCLIGGRSADCDFTGASLVGTHFGMVPEGHRGIWGCSFEDADLTNVDAAGVRFGRVSFKRARLVDARLARTQFVDCDLEGADCSGANLLRTSFEGVRWAGANLQDCLVDEPAAFAESGAIHADTVTAVARPVGPATLALARALEPVEKYFIAWVMRGGGVRRDEKAVVLRERGSAPPRGHTFDAATGGSLRMLTGFSSADVSPIMECFAAEYALWQADPTSIDTRGLVVEGVDIIALVRAALRELFP
ncbi:MAG TPA: pentapeptide repeat-containing protein [Phycisphaerae bacterium]|nr:pentapeptide repeat-containing protein [Phycisphaerae bacterium]